MKYQKFILKNYRAISEEIEIDLKKNSLLPIIGVNECGKTTILQAIFAFDYFNDDLNNGSHVENTQNLYKDRDKAPMITAIIEITNEDLYDVFKSLRKQSKYDLYKSKFDEYLNIDFEGSIQVTRNLYTHSYLIKRAELKDKKLNNIIAKELIVSLPYTLYFDDFRDSISDEIEIRKNGSEWVNIIEELFKRTDKNYSIFTLADIDTRRRRSIILRVQDHLNATLTKEWQNFRLDDQDALKIEIQFDQHNDGDKIKSYIKLVIIEKDEEGHSHVFYIKDRSKGFYWFFNFVMKTEFNPKSNVGSTQDTIYLLDEPGSYLHALAQSKLCKKLSSLSDKNNVIYCTHSHYLLNPETIPVNSIRIAEKKGDGRIGLNSIHEYTGGVKRGKNAFQPILDALEIKPLPFELNAEKIILTEGIYDFYALMMFGEFDQSYNLLPCTGADSIKYYISLMIAWNKSYVALWDNDKDGKDSLKSCSNYFGDHESKKSFRLLPLKGKGKKRILQDLLEGEDYKLIREKLKIQGKSSFEKTMLQLFFSNQRQSILSSISNQTKANFKELLDEIDSAFKE